MNSFVIRWIYGHIPAAGIDSIAVVVEGCGPDSTTPATFLNGHGIYFPISDRRLSCRVKPWSNIRDQEEEFQCIVKGQSGH